MKSEESEDSEFTIDMAKPAEETTEEMSITLDQQVDNVDV